MPSSSSSSSSSFSLVARDLARAHGAFTVLDAVDVAVGPRTRLGVVGPNGVGKTTLLRVLAGLDRPDRGTVTRTPPTLHVGYLPQEPERARDETLLAFLARRTGVAAAEAELERGGERPGRRRDDGRRRRLQRRARRLPRRRRPRLRRPRPRGRAPTSACPSTLLDAPTGDALGRAGGAGIARRDPAQPVRRVPARRADQRPRLRRARPARALPRRAARRCGRGEPRPRVPRAHRHAGARARRAHPRRRPSTAAAGRGTSTPGPRRGATPRRTTRSYRAERSRLEQRARTQRQWAVQGVREGEARRLGQRQGAARLPDQRVGEAGGEGAHHREGARAPRRGREAVGGLGAPVPGGAARRGAATW